MSAASNPGWLQVFSCADECGGDDLFVCAAEESNGCGELTVVSGTVSVGGWWEWLGDVGSDDMCSVGGVLGDGGDTGNSWGGDWLCDDEFSSVTFSRLVHFSPKLIHHWHIN